MRLSTNCMLGWWKLTGDSSQGEQSPAQKVEQKKQVAAQNAEQKEQSPAQKTDDNNGELSRALARIADLERKNSRLKGEIEQMKEQMIEQTESEERQGKDAMIAQLPEQIEQRLCALEGRLAQIEQGPAQGLAQIAQVPAQATEQAESGQAPCPAELPQVMGFKLKEKTTTTAGKVYRKWYATRGKEVVYVGNDPHKVEQKITAYLDRKNER